MITMDGTPQIRTRANTVAGTPLSSVSANRSSTNGGNVYKMADLHQKTALSHYRKCTIFEEIVFHELQTANFVGSCGYKTNYTNRGPGKQCVKVFRLLFGIKRQTMKPRCFVVRNVLPEKVLMQYTTLQSLMNTKLSPHRF